MNTGHPDPKPQSKRADNTELTGDETLAPDADQDTNESLDAVLKQLRNSPQDSFIDEPACLRMVETLQRQPPVAAEKSFERRTIDEYELLEPLGRGGMGEVYRARHKRLNQLVAVKLLHPDLADSRDALDRFEREMQAVGRVNHENIVQARHAGEDNGTLFLAMELVEGISCAEFLTQRGTLEVDEACRIIKQAATGLACAHENGLIHRDIKPSNMMIDDSGHVRLLDMGLACFNERAADIGELTRDGQMMGTPDYMSPEQVLDSRSVDARTDVYSLGATFYKLLVGRAPFADEQHPTIASRVMAIGSEEITPVCELREDVPERLSHLIQQMLAKDPTQRPESAQAVVEELCEIVVDEPSLQGTNLRQQRPVVSLQNTLISLVVVGMVIAVIVVAYRSVTDFGLVALGSAMPELKNLVEVDGIQVKDLDRDQQWSIRPGDSALELPSGSYAASLKGFGRLQIENQTGRAVNPEHFEVRRGDELQMTVLPPDGDFALQFDGSIYVDIPSLSAEPGEEYTIEAWIRLDPDRYLDAEVVPGNHGGVFTLCGAGMLTLSQHAANGGFLTRQIRNGTMQRCAGGAMNPARWHHLCVVSAKDYPSLYVDGQQVELDITEGSFSLDEPVGSSLLGSFPSPHEGSPAFGFTGQIGEVRVSRGVRYVTDFDPPVDFEADENTEALFLLNTGWGNRIVDSSGNSHHGEVRSFASESATLHWVRKNRDHALDPAARMIPRLKGPTDGAVRFGQVGDTIYVPELQGTFAGPITIEAWTRIDATEKKARILSWGGIGGLRLHPRSRGNSYVFSNRVLSESSQAWSVSSPYSPVDGEWYHVATTWENGVMKMFQNGVLVSSAVAAFTSGDPQGSEIYIGGPGTWLDGLIDELRVSSVVRYDENFVPAHRHEPDADTVLLFRFDEEDDGIVKDFSGNGHDGRLDGPVLVVPSQLPDAFRIPTDETDDYCLKLSADSESVVRCPLRYTGSHPLTVELLVRTSESSAAGTLIGSDRAFLSLDTPSPGAVENRLVAFRTNIKTTMHHTEGLTDKVAADSWIHVAGVWDEDVPRIFVNGRLISQRAGIGSTRRKFMSVNEFLIGTATKTLPCIDGFIDEVRISDVARYRGDFRPQPRFETDEHTLALYHFSEGAGETLHDSSGNDRHGQISGAEWASVFEAPSRDETNE